MRLQMKGQSSSRIAGCSGFSLIKGFLASCDQAALVELIGATPDRYQDHVSSLTHKISENSWKIYCCSETQRQLRNGRFVLAGPVTFHSHRFTTCQLRLSAAQAHANIPADHVPSPQHRFSEQSCLGTDEL